MESNSSYHFCIISRVSFDVWYLEGAWGYYDNFLCLNSALFFMFIAVVTRGPAQNQGPLVLGTVTKHVRMWALP